MSIYTDLQSARVLFDPDGEAVDFTDNNDMQALQLQQAQTLVAAGLPNAISQPTGFAPLSTWGAAEGLANNIKGTYATNGSDLILAPRAGAGYFTPGGSARQLVIAPGPIMQIVAGATPYAAASAEAIATFWLNDGDAGGPIAFTTDVGDAQPRIDAIECQLTYVDSDPTSLDFEDAVTREPSSQITDKRRRVQATIQVKKGTPSATPQIPANTAGFAHICAVYIPALHNAVHALGNMIDLRMPVGKVTVIEQRSAYMDGAGSTAWHRNDPIDAWEGPASGSGSIYFPCPVTSKAARVLAAGCYGVVAGTTGQKLVRELIAPGAITYTTLVDFSSDPTLIIVDTTEGYLERGMTEIMDAHANAGFESNIARNTNSRVGMPLWCNGYLNGMASDAGYPARLALKVTGSAGSRVRFVRWIVAE
jgi:hypothetical protein